MSNGVSPEAIQIAAKLNNLAAEARDPWNLLQKFTASLREVGEEGIEFERSEAISSIERALAYAIEDDPKYFGGALLGVKFSSADNDWPPAFNQVSESEKSVWVEVAEELDHLLPKAHFFDLLHSAGIQSTPAAGAKVVALYLELASTEQLDSYYRSSCLRRAWSVSRRFSLPEEQEARQELWSIAQTLSVAVETPLGVLLRPFDPLVIAPRSGAFDFPNKAEVQELLESVRETRWPHAPTVEGVSELLERLAPSDAEKAEVRRRLVEAYMELAQLQPGIAASSWYDEAYKLAEKYGFTDLRDQVVSARQEMPQSDLEMRSHFFDIQVPRHLVDVSLPRYRQAGDSRIALDLWLTGSSPTGRHEDNLRSVQKSTSESVLLQLVSRSTFNADGLPIKTTTGLESLEEESLERLELMSIGMLGMGLVRELELIKNTYGAPSASEVAAHLVLRYECDDELAEAFGEALNSFWDGRHTDAGRAAYPLVEAGARGLLLTLGDPLYRMPTENVDGRFPALFEYSKRLEAHDFDIDWLRCLLNPVSYFRNALAHGHLHHLKPHEAAVLLRVAGLLVTLTPNDSSKSDRANVKRRLRDPIGWAAGKAKFVRRTAEVWTVDTVEGESPSAHAEPK